MHIIMPTGIARRAARHGVRVALLAGCALMLASCSTGKYDWQCSAPGGTYSEHDVDVPDTATQFTGEMVFKKVDPSTQWLPAARLGFTDRNAMDSDCHCNGINAIWYPADPKFITVSLLADGHDVTLGRVPYENPVTFKLTYAKDGELKLEVGTGIQRAFSPTPTRNRLHFNCTSADVDFQSIEVK